MIRVMTEFRCDRCGHTSVQDGAAMGPPEFPPEDWLMVELRWFEPEKPGPAGGRSGGTRAAVHHPELLLCNACAVNTHVTAASLVTLAIERMGGR